METGNTETRGSDAKPRSRVRVHVDRRGHVDSSPGNCHESRRSRLLAWLAEGRLQTALSAREYARRRYHETYGRNPKPEYWP